MHVLLTGTPQRETLDPRPRNPETLNSKPLGVSGLGLRAKGPRSPFAWSDGSQTQGFGFRESICLPLMEDTSSPFNIFWA